MDKAALLDYIHDACIIAPDVQRHLKSDVLMSAFSQVKSLEYFSRNVEHLVRSVYGGYIGGDFVDILGNLITGQMRDAYEQAWKDSGGQGPMPDYLRSSLGSFTMTNVNFDYIYQYYKDIVDARVDGTSVDPLISRAQLWINRYNEAVNTATLAIEEANGGKLVWVYGDTEHCETCGALNGLVAFASEWQTSGIKPQSAPNNLLSCGGWKCQCRLEKTDKRRSPKVMQSLLDIATARFI